MNDSQSRFAKMPAAPPSPPTLPRQSCFLGSPTEETGELEPPRLDLRNPAEEPGRATAENALPAAPAPESPGRRAN